MKNARPANDTPHVVRFARSVAFEVGGMLDRFARQCALAALSRLTRGRSAPSREDVMLCALERARRASPFVDALELLEVPSLTAAHLTCARSADFSPREAEEALATCRELALGDEGGSFAVGDSLFVAVFQDCVVVKDREDRPSVTRPGLALVGTLKYGADRQHDLQMVAKMGSLARDTLVLLSTSQSLFFFFSSFLGKRREKKTGEETDAFSLHVRSLSLSLSLSREREIL